MDPYPNRYIDPMAKYRQQQYSSAPLNMNIMDNKQYEQQYKTN